MATPARTPAIGADPSNPSPAVAAGLSSSSPPAEPAGGPPEGLTEGGGPASLDDSETTVDLRLANSPTQARVHAPWAEERSRLVVALAGSRDPSLEQRARTMAACCCSPLVQRAPDGQIRICPIRCRDRLCPLCCLRRAREVALRFAAAVGAMDAARHLVLTAPAVDAPLAEQLAELRAGMKRLRQSAAWKAHVRGGCYTIEITRNRKTGLWHPHVHVIMDGAFFPHAEARAAWAAALGGSPLWPDLATTGRVIVHLSAVHHRSRLATYIAKYIAKPAELGRWTAAAICEYARALKGVRMLHTFGSLHGVKLAPPDPNPDRAGSETLIGLGELDWRARQGWPEAERAVALIRRLQPKLGRWIGTPTRDADAEWADGVDDPNGMLGMLCGQVRRISSMQGPAPPQIRRPRRGAGRSGEQGGGPLLWPAAVS